MLDLVLLARPSAEHRNVRLKFVGVVEFGFYYRSDYGFYDVENVKFLMAEDGSFYLSIDPDMEQSGCSKSDQDFVKAMSVELILDEE